MSVARALAVLAVVIVAPAVSANPVPPQKPDDREVHVVGVYEGWTAKPRGFREHPQGRVAVKLDRPGKLVTLVLTACEPVAWEVTATESTRLTRVILGGYSSQAVNELPKHVEVVPAFRNGQGGQPALSYVYKIETETFRPLIQHLRTTTGVEITSFHGAYRGNPEQPFVVDRVQTDPRLQSDWPRPEPAGDFPKLEFPAIHFVPGRLHGMGNPSLGVFRLTAGPDLESLRPLPERIKRVVAHVGTNQSYALADHDIFQMNVTTNEVVKLNLDPALPKMSWPKGLAFDTKRERVLVAANHLYAYTPETGKWEVVRELRGGDNRSLAYHAPTDLLYLLKSSFGSEEAAPVLVAMNAAGAVVRQTELTGPLVPGLLGRMPDSNAQLVAADKWLVLLATTSLNPGQGGRQISETFIYLIEPGTGKARLGWKDSAPAR